MNADDKQKKLILNLALGKDAQNDEYKNAIDYVYDQLKTDILDEYIVDGAILGCEKALAFERYIDNCCFNTENKGQSQLVVYRMASIDEHSYANVSDTKKYKNIIPFGNCIDDLTEAEKNRLKSIPDAKQKGICKYLMRLCEYWETLPEGLVKSFKVEGYPAITMQSRLFCLRGAFIFPITSGQEVIKYGYEDTALGVMSIDDILFAFEFQLNEEQMVIFKEMKEYYEDVPILKTGNTIFAFEGLGNRSGVTNELHPNGQYNALFIICKDGKPIYATGNCSTLPDRTNNATTRDGVYKAVFRNHKDHYSALQLRLDCGLEIREESEIKERMDSNMKLMNIDIDKESENKRVLKDVAAYRFSERSKWELPNGADGVNLHMSKDLSPGISWSVACLTVKSSEYYEFGVTAGFIEEQKDGVDYSIYENIYDVIKTKHEGEDWGYIVVNREYMNPEERKVFLPDYETQMEND